MRIKLLTSSNVQGITWLQQGGQEDHVCGYKGALLLVNGSQFLGVFHNWLLCSLRGCADPV